MMDVMLTTTDNPYDPFTHWDEWLAYDMLKGHNTCGMLARITNHSDEMSEADQRVEHENAVNEIVSINSLGIYKKVTRNSS